MGFIANAAAELTPVILHEFGQRFPHVDVHMRQFAFTDPLAGPADGDVAFVRTPLKSDQSVDCAPLLNEERVLILSDRHPLAQLPAVTVEMVVDESFVARRAPREWREFWLGVDHRDGHTVRVGAEVSTVDECLEAVLTGRSIAFTQASSQRYDARPGLAFVPVQLPEIRDRYRDAQRPRARLAGHVAGRGSAPGSHPRAAGPGGGLLV